MIDPISITVSIALFSAFSFVSYKLGRRAEHQSMVQDPEGKAAYKEKLERAEIRITSLDYDLQNNKRWCKEWRAAAEQHVKEKENFKEMALSHEVKWPEPPKVKFEKRQVWEKRRYSNHPSANLKALANDLKEFKGREVNMVLDLRPCGGWKEIVQGRGFRDDSFFKKMGFEGPPERVLEEITAFFKDHDMPFMTRVDPAKGHPVHEKGSFGENMKWNDTDSAVVMQIDMQVTERIEPALKPEVHIVQVPVIETQVIEIEKVVERILEKSTVDQEQLAALVEVTVQEQLTKRALSRAPLSDSLERGARIQAAQAQKTGG